MEGDAAAVQGDQRAWVKDLGPEVRDFGRLAVVKLGDEPRVGNGSRVRGQDPGHVLPEDHPRRPQRAGEEGRREVGAAAAEGRHRAVGPEADEAGDHGGDAPPEQGGQSPAGPLPRGHQVGSGRSVPAVGRHHLGGVDALGLPARGVKGRRQDCAGRPLSARDQGVAGPGGQLAQRGHRVGDLLVLAGLMVGGGEEGPAHPARGHQLHRDVPVPAQERGRHRGRRRGVTPGRAPRAPEQGIGHPAQGRDDHRHGARMAADQVHRVADGARVDDRGPPELPDLEGGWALPAGAHSRDPRGYAAWPGGSNP